MDQFTTEKYTYVWTKEMPIDRYIHMQKLLPEVKLGITWETFYNEVAGALILLNKPRFADGCTKLSNALNAVKNTAEAKEYAALLLITLFINRPGDEKEKWKRERAEDYIMDWCDNLLDIRPFLAAAFKMFETLNLDFDPSSHDTLKANIENKKAKRKKAMKTQKST